MQTQNFRSRNDQITSQACTMTILSSKNKFLFIHLHKCGGTSIEQSYEEVAHWSDVIIGSIGLAGAMHDYYREKFSLSKHSSVMEIANVIGTEDYHDMTGFALVRDPYSVFESFYGWTGKIFAYSARINESTIENAKQIVATGGEKADQLHFADWGSSKAYANSTSFNDFVEISLKNQSLPQVSMCKRLGIGTELEPKYIFQLGEIECFWEALENYLGTSLKRTHSNASKTEDGYRWNKENVAKVGQIFSQDIEKFGFDYKPTVC